MHPRQPHPKSPQTLLCATLSSLLLHLPHTTPGKSRELVLFLQADEASLQHAKDEWKRTQSNQPQKVLRLFKQAFTQMEQSLSNAPTGSVAVPHTELDGQVDDISTCVHVLEVHYHSVSRESSGWVRREKEAGDGCFQLGLALTLLGQNEAGGLGEVVRAIGHAVDGVSVLAIAAVEEEGVLLEEPLVEWSKAVGAAKAALFRRAEARKGYHEALVEVAARLHAKGKWVGMIGKEEKLNAAELAWGKAVEAAEKKKKEFENVSERLVRDWKAFKEEKAREVQRVVVAFVEAQVKRHEKMREAWEQVLPKVKGVDVMQVLDQKPVKPAPAAATAAAAGGEGGKKVAGEAGGKKGGEGEEADTLIGV